MLAPALSQEWFDEMCSKGFSAYATISKLNAKNCKADFSRTIPKALREEGWNSILVIKNHKERWKYMGFNVEDIKGALHIKDFPDFIWSGYVFYNNQWYAVSAESILAGRISNEDRIIIPQIEFAEES